MKDEELYSVKIHVPVVKNLAQFMLSYLRQCRNELINPNYSIALNLTIIISLFQKAVLTLGLMELKR
jgi:hypothetical protein